MTNLEKCSPSFKHLVRSSFAYSPMSDDYSTRLSAALDWKQADYDIAHGQHTHHVHHLRHSLLY